MRGAKVASRHALSGAVPVLVALAMGLTSSSASAARPSGRAETMFVRGKQLYDRGFLDAACEAFVESDRTEPTVGARGMIAACLERRGRAADAWRAYNETAARAHALSDGRERFALRKAAALAPKLARLVVRLAAEDPSVDVLRNGERIQPGSTGAETFVDPGDFEIVARASGRAPWSQLVHVVAGQRMDIDIPALESVQPAAEGPRTQDGGGPAGGAGAAASPDAVARRPSAWRKPVIYTAGAASVAGFTVGTGLLIAAFDKSKASHMFCDADDRCSPEGGALRDEARALATVSTVAFGIGIVGVGGALAVILTSRSDGAAPASAPPRVSAEPLVGPSVAGAVVHGFF